MTNFIQDPIVSGFKIVEKEKEDLNLINLKTSSSKTSSDSNLIPILIISAIGGIFLLRK